MLETLRSLIRFRQFESDPAKRRLAGVANIEDLRRIAKSRLPGGVFDYIDGGAEDEISLGRNSAAFDEIELRPRVLRDVSGVDTSREILGRSTPLPLILAPTGFGRITGSAGELAACRSAAKADVPYSLSTMATRSIEEVAQAQSNVLSTSTDPRRWFQVYVWKDKGLLKQLLERAKASQYEAIIITVDTAVLGRRERDVRRGFTLPPKLGLNTVIDAALHPAWLWDFLRADPIKFANVVGESEDGSDAVSLADHVHRQFDQSLSWDDLAWFKEQWDGPVVIKGIQTVEDAVLAAEHGVDAIALSNHGGRQLDSAPVPAELIEPVVQAVAGRAQIYCDGGVRRGSDIFKAIALGADACMIGRPYLYGMAAGGEAGVDWVIDFFRSGLAQTMALSGVRTTNQITPDLVHRRSL